MKAKQSEMEKKALRKRIYQYRVQYLFLVPAFVAVIIFAYIPWPVWSCPLWTTTF